MCSRRECLPLTSCSSKRSYNSSFTNVALRKNVKLSSLYLNFQGDLMVDGNRTTFMHTNFDANPYAMIDLGDTYLVYSIYIVNRKDCCPIRLHDVSVQIGNDLSRLDIAARHKAAIGADCTLQFPKPYRGRYVQIQLEATAYLQIGEVEVYRVI
ncbi:uncharacterized protein LOC128554951 [Mercenaria mercenaria]|uniref:uncharacterized protein LOC128554951 n=1 Tax=Mercenaria mercenaria TaxID=6596 RepID=UPI00234F37FE|nr:uncharacterized protein LOC128554951 [Mercenaria mercenaria]